MLFALLLLARYNVVIAGCNVLCLRGVYAVLTVMLCSFPCGHWLAGQGHGGVTVRSLWGHLHNTRSNLHKPARRKANSQDCDILCEVGGRGGGCGKRKGRRGEIRCERYRRGFCFIDTE